MVRTSSVVDEGRCPSAKRTLAAVLLGLVAAWLAASSGGGTGPEPGPTRTTPSRPPAAVGAVPDREIALGDAVQIDVSSYFLDPDGDGLTYAA